MKSFEILEYLIKIFNGKTPTQVSKVELLIMVNL